jgi:hypothetical protein
MKHWMVVVAVASMIGFGCGASAEDMAGSVRKANINKEEPKKPLVNGAIDLKDRPKYGGKGPLGGKGDGSGGDPGGDSCADGYVPCGTGPCCHAATERCGDGHCHAREGASGGGSAGDLPETQTPDSGGGNGGIR